MDQPSVTLCMGIMLLTMGPAQDTKSSVVEIVPLVAVFTLIGTTVTTCRSPQMKTVKGNRGLPGNNRQDGQHNRIKGAPPRCNRCYCNVK